MLSDRLTVELQGTLRHHAPEREIDFGEIGIMIGKLEANFRVSRHYERGTSTTSVKCKWMSSDVKESGYVKNVFFLKGPHAS